MPSIVYHEGLDDPKYENSPVAQSIKDLYQAINLGGLDSDNISAIGIKQLNNPYKARAYRNTSTQSLPDATETTVIFNAETYDTNNNFDITTGLYTAPVTGWYQVNSAVYCTVTTNIGSHISIIRDSTTVSLGFRTTESAVGMIISDTVYATKGQTIGVQAYGNGTGTGEIQNSSSQTYLSIHLISI